MKIISALLLCFLTVYFIAGCNSSKDNKPKGNNKPQARQYKSDTNAVSKDTARAAVVKKTDTVAAKTDNNVSEDEFNGNWDDNNTGMHVSISKINVKVTNRGRLESILRYYVQYDHDTKSTNHVSQVSFFGYYRFKTDTIKSGRGYSTSINKKVLVCDKYNGDYNGELDNEYVKNSKFQLTEDRKNLVFTCDNCETSVLTRTH